MASPEQGGDELLDYYQRRAAHYEAIYARPERQDNLAFLRGRLAATFSGMRVLEVACGTGYWTAAIAPAAQAVLATDLAEEPVRIARTKAYPPGKVRFAMADAYSLPTGEGRFDAAFAGFWWSHVPRQRIDEFVGSLHACLEPGARVVMIDNIYVEGISTPVAGADIEGNTYQMRRLHDGSRVKVLKNFTTSDELRERLEPYAHGFSYQALDYYWLVEYRVR